MKKFKPLLLVVFVAAAVAILGYAYVVFHERYKEDTESNNNVNTNENKSLIDDFSDLISGNSGNVNANLNENLNGNENANSNSNANANTNVSRDQLNSKDCDNHCARFKDNPDNFAYCQQVCGDAASIQRTSPADCANLAGDQKDYCLKDLAVEKKDYSICDQITDAKIKKTCKNRITEDLIN